MWPHISLVQPSITHQRQKGLQNGGLSALRAVTLLPRRGGGRGFWPIRSSAKESQKGALSRWLQRRLFFFIGAVRGGGVSGVSFSFLRVALDPEGGNTRIDQARIEYNKKGNGSREIEIVPAAVGLFDCK